MSVQAPQGPTVTPVCEVQQPKVQENFEKLKGQLFLIPCRVEWVKNPCAHNHYPELFEGEVDQYRTADGEILTIEVWATNEECENWYAHSRMWKNGPEDFPNRIPVKFLLGKKEGDQFEFSCAKFKKTFSLVCQQQGFRYEDEGNFEKLLEEMFMVAYNVMAEKSKEKDFTGEKLVKWQNMQRIKAEYYPNSEVNHRGLNDQLDRLKELNKKV